MQNLPKIFITLLVLFLRRNLALPNEDSEHYNHFLDVLNQENSEERDPSYSILTFGPGSPSTQIDSLEENVSDIGGSFGFQKDSEIADNLLDDATLSNDFKEVTSEQVIQGRNSAKPNKVSNNQENLNLDPLRDFGNAIDNQEASLQKTILDRPAQQTQNFNLHLLREFGNAIGSSSQPNPQERVVSRPQQHILNRDPEEPFSCVNRARGYYADVASQCTKFFACVPSEGVSRCLGT